MFKNLPIEVFLYSMLPVIVIVFLDLLLFLIKLKKEKSVHFNYFIKISLMVANAFVLPLIGGYTIWIFLKFIKGGIIFDNILYVALLVFLWLCLFVLLIWVYMKTRKELNEYEPMEDIPENSMEIEEKSE